MQENGDFYQLSEKYRLYLKEIYKLIIKIKVPVFKIFKNEVLSNWELLEKIHLLVTPYSFLQLKVTLNTVDGIQLEGETETKSDCKKIVNLLQDMKFKISGIPEYFHISASIYASNITNKNEFSKKYHEARNSDPNIDRLDTLHIKGLPTLWFSDKNAEGDFKNKPVQQIVESVFSKFGSIRNMYIPINNPLFSNTDGGFNSIVSINSSKIDAVTTILTFEAFIQYKSYKDLLNAISHLKNRKLVFKDGKFGDSSNSFNLFNAEIVIDFDQSDCLSDYSIRKRNKSIKEYFMRIKENSLKEQKKKECDGILNEKLKSQVVKRKIGKKHKQKKEDFDENAKSIKKLKKAVKEEKKYICQQKIESVRVLSVLYDKLKSVSSFQNLMRMEQVAIQYQTIFNLLPYDYLMRQEEADVVKNQELEIEEFKHHKPLLEDISKKESIELRDPREHQKDKLLKRELELRERLMRKVIKNRFRQITDDSSDKEAAERAHLSEKAKC